MKIAFVCIDAAGHLNPMTALARAVKARGHEVVCVALPQAKAVAEAAQLPFAAYAKGEFSAEAQRAALLRYSSLHGGEAGAYSRELTKAGLAAAFKHLPRTLREIRAGAVVLDQVHFGLGLVPMHLGIPYAHASCAVHLDLTGTTPLPMFGWPHASTEEELQRSREAATQFRRVLQPLRSLAETYAASAGIRVDWTDPWATQSQLAWVTQMPREFDFPASHWPSCFHHTGPWYDANGRAPVVFPWQQLTGQPLIYASMGTLLNGTARPFGAILEAARANPGLQMVLSIGANLDPTQLPSLPANAVVVRYAPQFELLKRAAVCITHAGMNTTLEALAQGVPLLAIPVGTDQPGVAARIRHTRTGIPVPFDAATPARIAAALREILEDGSYRENAMAMQSAIHRADGLQRGAGLLEEAFGLEPEPQRRQPSRFAWLRPFAQR
jgi:MGT family glycosyltransferase